MNLLMFVFETLMSETLLTTTSLAEAVSAWQSPGVLANLSEISRYGRSYIQNQQYVLVISVLAAFGVFFLVLNWVGQLLARQTEQKNKVPEKTLLSQISQALKLTSAEESLITHMAEKHQIQPPEVLLIDPSLWNLCLNSSPQDQDQLLTLAEKLFGSERCRLLRKS